MFELRSNIRLFLTHPVDLDERIKGRQGFGLIQVFTGNGKGKTTAGLGEAIRAAGAGKRVGIVFFDKGGTHYSERNILTKLGIAWIGTGRDRIDAQGRFDFSINDIDRAEALRGVMEARQMFAEGLDLVILDELNSTTSLGILPLEEAVRLIDEKSDQTELILTGRNAPQVFLDRAHLITEMRLEKHYFYSGVKAREGLDF